MSPVRASPTIGGNLLSTTTIGSTVKPIARRSGATISSPLQIVGVSQAFRSSRSLAVNGCLLIISRCPCDDASRFHSDLSLLESLGQDSSSPIDPGRDKDDDA